MVHINASQLIPGDGEPVSDGVVVLDGSEITYSGPAADAPDSPSAQVVQAETVMPGMWDCHTHLMGLAAGVVNLEALITQTPQIGVLRAARDAAAALDAGFTSVREVGGFGALLARAAEEGIIRSPTIYGAGAAISQTGGHGDFHGLTPAEADAVVERLWGAPSLADGPDDCRRVVRRQLRLGARVIKVCASGGVMSQIDHPIHQQFSREELVAIVEEAGRAGRVVAAHCHGKPGIMAAVEAGVKTIEHGSYLDDETAAAMRERQAILVPTRWIVEHLGQVGRSQGMPDYAIAKLDMIAGRHREAVELAIETGVDIACGTDIWGAGMWGRNAEELGHLVRLGMSPLDAIRSATATGPMTVGAQAPQSGVLRTGYAADVITVDANPLDDISVLADTNRIKQVWKSGELVK
ncbi:MAG TPA: amidohydrolase family protein [Acidimicrobiia bacterium]|nr:amidohydrolase family protein [Acidimicrobiia bacterium]